MTPQAPGHRVQACHGMVGTPAPARRITRMALIAAIDQGTTSTRVCITRTDGKVVAQSQFEHAQHMPQKGWVEHDPMEIWRNTRRALSEALADEDISEQDIDALGLTNQRETAVIWEKETGKPIYNAIVWQDTRTNHDGDAGKFLRKTCLLYTSPSPRDLSTSRMPSSA